MDGGTVRPTDVTIDEEVRPMRTRPGAIAAGALALTLLLAACGSAAHTSDGASGSTASSAAETGPAADIAFAQLMIPHHQQAIEMADLALERPTSPEVNVLAQQIKGAQDPEIALMRGWLEAWGAPLEMEGDDHSGHDMGGLTMSGMMSEEDMAALAAAEGAEFDRMWVTMMIAHHEGAVAMAQDVLATTADPQVTTLAQAVIAGQTAEIATMRGLLAG
jgi:uncharacterized protein (DUF305 family)